VDNSKLADSGAGFSARGQYPSRRRGAGSPFRRRAKCRPLNSACPAPPPRPRMSALPPPKLARPAHDRVILVMARGGGWGPAGRQCCGQPSPRIRPVFAEHKETTVSACPAPLLCHPRRAPGGLFCDRRSLMMCGATALRRHRLRRRRDVAFLLGDVGRKSRRERCTPARIQRQERLRFQTSI
jgi:hypothetical protein